MALEHRRYTLTAFPFEELPWRVRIELRDGRAGSAYGITPEDAERGAYLDARDRPGAQAVASLLGRDKGLRPGERLFMYPAGCEGLIPIDVLLPNGVRVKGHATIDRSAYHSLMPTEEQMKQLQVQLTPDQRAEIGRRHIGYTEWRGLAEGCCSAVTPCSHQKRDPHSICDVCTAARHRADAFARAPVAGSIGEHMLGDAWNNGGVHHPEHRPTVHVRGPHPSVGDIPDD